MSYVGSLIWLTRMKKCTYCGQEYPDGTATCERDGTSLSPPTTDSPTSGDSGFLGRLFSFEGRVSRGTYWGVQIFAVVVWWVFQWILVASGMSRDSVMLFFWIGTAVIGWVGLAVSARRWHDMDCSAWCLLILLIPFIGWLVTLGALGFRTGTAGPNQFGPDPLLPNTDGTAAA